ncbi:MAG: type III-A CRISPR-associated RAMP protein Csm5, partial [Caloramator sp.]|nr:type III-A CRISPR-associated RAMP protein Csm5 [Caloramator sp.]
MDYKVNYYEIEVLSPTTVTSGDKIPSFQVVVDKNKAYVIDILKMIKSNKKALGVVETFNFNSNESISDKLKREGIEYRNYVKYVLDYNSSTNRIREINEIMKTAGRPYIPGSSIKGAVRSALSRAINKEDAYLRSLEDSIRDKEDKERRNPNRKFDVSTTCDDNAEKELFGSPNYSPFRFLNISDTDVVDFSSLELCDIKVLNVCNGKVKWFAGRENIDDIQRAVSIHTEVLKKGTRLKGKISSGFIEYFRGNNFIEIK